MLYINYNHVSLPSYKRRINNRDMSNTGINISKYLGWPGSGSQGQRNTGWFASKDTGSTLYPSTTSSTGSYYNTGDSTGSIKRILAFVLAIIIVMIILLLFVDKYITPIFRSQPGSPGIVTLPWTDTGVLFWKTNSDTIKNEVTPIRNKFFDYSFILDIFIENPIYFTNQPRILVSRGGMPIDASGSTTVDRTTLLSVLQYYNFVVALLPDTTDMIVSVLNQNHIMENIIIPNITVQNTFRLGVVIMDKAFEVYIDGRLMKTRSYGAPLLDVRGDIVAGSTNVAKLRTLKIWDRALIAPEIREAKPPLTKAATFGADPIPGSSTCLDSVKDAVDPSAAMSAISSYTSSILPDSVKKGISSVTASIENIIPGTSTPSS